MVSVVIKFEIFMTVDRIFTRSGNVQQKARLRGPCATTRKRGDRLV
jgi:hypothetical protein